MVYREAMLRFPALLLLTMAAVLAQTGAVRAFTGATLIDGSGKAPVADAVLIVRDGKVEAAGPAKSVKVPKGAQVVNLAGKTVIPGLVAAHVHVSDVNGLKPAAYTEENTQRQLGVFARYGITTLWSLGGEREPAFKARDTQ